MAIVVSPTSKAFGSVTSGSSSSAQAFSLSPDVTTDSIWAIVVTGNDATQFKVTAQAALKDANTQGQYNFISSQLLTAVNADAFEVTFSPTSTGAKVAQAEVHYNGAGGSSTLVIALTGTGA